MAGSGVGTNVIIVSTSVADNRDGPVTRGHRPVAVDPESSGHPAGRVGWPSRRPPEAREGEPFMQSFASKLGRRALAAVAAVTLLASMGASGVLAGGPPTLGFYVDDVRYRTVGTPTDFFGTGAPLSTYDKIFNLGTGINVAEAKPGDRDFNGGRWLVYTVTWHVTPVQYTNVEDIYAAADRGDLTINPEPVKAFFCNVAPVPGSSSER